MGKSSDEYSGTCTGATRAKEHLNVVRREDVSPFERTVFDPKPSNARKKS